MFAKAEDRRLPVSDHLAHPLFPPHSCRPCLELPVSPGSVPIVGVGSVCEARALARPGKRDQPGIVPILQHPRSRRPLRLDGGGRDEPRLLGDVVGHGALGRLAPLDALEGLGRDEAAPIHSSFTSTSTDPTSLSIDFTDGKTPTALVLRLISSFARSCTLLVRRRTR